MAQNLVVQALHAGDAARLAELWCAQDAASRARRFHGTVDAACAALRWRLALQAGALRAWGVCHPDQPSRLLAEACAAPAQDAPGWELALLVDRGWRRQGLGRGLLTCVLAAARNSGVASLHALVQADNLPMQALALSLGAVDARSAPAACSQAELAQAELTRALEYELGGRVAGSAGRQAGGTTPGATACGNGEWSVLSLCWAEPPAPAAEARARPAAVRGGWWQRWTARLR